MKKNFLILLCAFLVLNVFFAGCDEDDDTPQVGVCLKATGNEWRNSLKKHAERYLNQYGRTYSISQSGLTQAADIRNMLGKGVEVMIIMPEDPDNINEAVSEVISAGVPVIFAESAAGTDYTALVKIDNEDIGRSAGEFFNKQTDISKIVLFTVTQDPVSSSGRIDGIKEVLDAGLTTVEYQLSAYTAAAGKAAMQQILNDPDMADVNAVYAQDDDIATGVLEAIEAISSQRIKAVVGCGGSYAFFQKIQESININLATTLYSPAAFMEKSAEIANAVLKGREPAEKIINLESELVDKDNVEAHMANAPY